VHQSVADGARYALPNPNPGGTPNFPVSEEAAQFADSSRSMALFYKPMRLFGAGIRLVFERAGARHFGVDASQCHARQHRVYHGDHSIDYKFLLLHAGKVAVPTPAEAEAAFKPREQWNYIGTEKMPFIDARDMVTGKAVYGADAGPDRPGMLTAMIVRCPVANGEVKSFDDTATRKVPGVVNVVKVRLPSTVLPGGVGAGFMPHAGVAVVAENTWAALQGRRALKVEWDLSQLGALNRDYDSKAFRGKLEELTKEQGKTLRSRGNIDAASMTVSGDYYVPHLAQAPMEPPAAIALYENGRWEIWSPTQGPELAQHYVGLAMLEPNPVRWLLWQVTELTEILKECERADQRDFNEYLGKTLGVDQPTLFSMRDKLKKEIREKVTVHATLLGGGFGRKSKPDYAIEAAFLARVHPGVPVRVQWTREDDIQFSYFHSVSHQHLEASLDGDGHCTAWLQRSAFPSFFATLFPPPDYVPEAVRPLFAKARAGYHGGGEYPYGAAIERAQGLEDMPFDVKNMSIENCPTPNHIRVGWMRSVSNIFHAFSIGSFADELAIKAGRDSKDNLLDLIGKEARVLDLEAEGAKCFDNNGFPPLKMEGIPPLVPPYPPDTRRLREVVKLVAKESGWDEKVKQYKKLKGRGLGIAAHRSFLSYVAIVIDVSLNDRNELTINELHGAIDCGLAVNVDRVKAQMEGGMLYGLSYALLGEITVKNGAVEQHNFDDYPVLRIHQAPKKISVYIMPSTGELPTGVGEPPTPAVAPALANAIVAAGGPRIREIPFGKKREKGGWVVVL
jgi:isoquinoline 1-oxidoreductase beta subunit